MEFLSIYRITEKLKTNKELLETIKFSVCIIGNEPEIEEMDSEQLREYLAQLEEQLAELDAREPKNEEAEEYDNWADKHEDLEDLIEEVKDRLDEIG